MPMKLFMAGIAAACLLAVGVANASANNLSTSSRTFRITWSSISLGSAEEIVIPIRCPITLEGSFHSGTIRKVAGALIGYVTRATIPSAACTSGTATIGQESLPWHVRYKSFEGTLPRITGVRFSLNGQKATVVPAGFPGCTTQVTASNPLEAVARLESGRTASIVPDETVRFPLRGSFVCEIGGNAIVAGRGTPTVLGAATAIIVTLI